MKLMVTGGAGFIGSALIRLAIKRGLSIVNVDCLTYAANLQNLTSVATHPNYDFEQVDICHGEALERLFQKHQPDAVMHLAAESHVDRSIDGPQQFIQTNIVGTYNLLNAARAYIDRLTPARAANFRFHHVSTDEVFGDLAQEDPSFSEETRYNPSSPYSASKAASDHLVRAWARTYGLPILISNCSNNYGSHQFPEKLIPTTILKALAQEPIPIYGTGDNIRDWLFVEDHADALLTALQSGNIGETYNIGGDNEQTNLDVVKALCQMMDHHSSIKRKDHSALISFVADRAGHDQRYAVNSQKIKADLGWSPKTSWENGLSKTLDWYLTHESWWRPLLDKKKIGTRLGVGKR